MHDKLYDVKLFIKGCGCQAQILNHFGPAIMAVSKICCHVKV